MYLSGGFLPRGRGLITSASVRIYTLLPGRIYVASQGHALLLAGAPAQPPSGFSASKLLTYPMELPEPSLIALDSPGLAMCAALQSSSDGCCWSRLTSLRTPPPADYLPYVEAGGDHVS